MIEDDVFVEMGALVMKGVTIGGGAMVGARSVGTQNVPHAPSGRAIRGWWCASSEKLSST